LSCLIFIRSKVGFALRCYLSNELSFLVINLGVSARRVVEIATLLWEPTVCYVVLTRDVKCRSTRIRSRTCLLKVTLPFSSVVELRLPCQRRSAVGAGELCWARIVEHRTHSVALADRFKWTTRILSRAWTRTASIALQRHR